MNRAKLKSYAPKARKDFLRAVSDRARKVGLTPGHTEPVEVRGDVAIIGGQAFPKRVADQRRRLDEQIRRKGFTAVMEEVAYTWFNRFMAMRYMELHGYLEHGYRVLSHPNGIDRPEILEQAENVTLPGLDKGMVIDLKLDGTKDEELYKLLLLGQCHALHLAMPFLFERIDDQTELLLPDNLLSSDSVIRKMVVEIAEEDWQQIEIIGWLYQFYIIDEKARVDAELKAGKPVASRDIPAKTQLFTPSWIVKYMVQNSLGRQWLATYPQSPLRAQMEYYIEPAEQTDQVQAQLAVITPKELDPEALTLIDPACGSGHILVEAYDLYKEIYLERGYRLRDIPRLILEKNLFGLEIDDRAAQMAGFGLLMKARADDRRILDQAPMLNVRAIQSSAGLDAAELASVLLAPKKVEIVPIRELFPETRVQPTLAAEEVLSVRPQDIKSLCDLFTDAKNLGSLIEVPAEIIATLSYFCQMIEGNHQSGDLLARQAAENLEPLVAQGVLLARQYNVSVMNPPYLGGKGLNNDLKKFALRNYPDSKFDLFAMFIERSLTFTTPCGYSALVTMENWMFLSAFEALRETVLSGSFLQNLIQMPYEGKQPTAMGISFGVCSFCLRRLHSDNYSGAFSKIRFQDLQSDGHPKSINIISNPQNYASSQDIRCIPGLPIAYWVSKRMRELFAQKKLEEYTISDGQNITGNNERFVRMHWEINREETPGHAKWKVYAKGGDYRKWYGNLEYVVDWSEEARRAYRRDDSARIIPEYLWNRLGITWTLITSTTQSFRVLPVGATFDKTGSSLFLTNDDDISYVLAFLNSCVAAYLLRILNPTVALQIRNVRDLPFLLSSSRKDVERISNQLVALYKDDWDAYERSREFMTSPLVRKSRSLNLSFETWQQACQTKLQDVIDMESNINVFFIEAYGLQDELFAEVEDHQITLARAVRDKDIQRLISYALGCMVGRYSLDQPGLIYAHSGNKSFDPSRYTTFPADTDGILPLTDSDWFGGEDTANRFGDFLKAAWPVETYHENVQFVADSLSPKAGEAPMETIRRYLATGFYKDHLQTYKKRPIYWLFSSGKERAFQALVYLHRYNEGTLARIRMEYVVPLQSRLSARIEQIDKIDKDIAASTSTVDRKKREGERAKLSRQYLELLAFDEKLRHYADQRIHLDLDDGVKVNYGKFGDLLAEVKAITGDKDE